MWWPGRGRRRHDEGRSPHLPGSTSSAEPAPPSQAWADLPPIQRTTAAPPTVTGLDAFRETLTTRQDPRFLEPLGHLVDAAAPSGHVDGVATPAPVGTRSFS